MKAALTLAALAAFAAAGPLAADEPISKGEAKLAKMLEGRVAGEPRSCVNMFGSGNLQIIDGTALVYKRGNTLWVNRTADPSNLDSDDYLVIRKSGGTSQLCRLDNVTTQDRSGNFLTGIVFLEDFVPYRRSEG
jgi:hypothetical protein